MHCTNQWNQRPTPSKTLGEHRQHDKNNDAEIQNSGCRLSDAVQIIDVFL